MNPTISDLSPAQAHALVESIKGRGEAPVVIDFKTAEYLAVLIGQTNWGNQERRASAGAALGEALGNRPLATSQECFASSEGKGRGR